MKKPLLKLLDTNAEPRIIKLGSRVRQPIALTGPQGPQNQADIDAVPVDHEPMYLNQQMGRIALNGKPRAGWSRLILKLKRK